MLAWNKQLTGSEPTRVQRHECRAVARALNSMSLLSIKEGNNHDVVITQIHRIIERLVAVGVLPADAVIGRQEFLGVPYLKRTAIASTIFYLDEYEEVIKDYIEDNLPQYNPDDVFNILLIGSVIGSTLGFSTFDAPILNKLVRVTNALPGTTTKMSVLRSPESLEKLLLS
jgi:hypothetical protein